MPLGMPVHTGMRSGILRRKGAIGRHDAMPVESRVSTENGQCLRKLTRTFLLARQSDGHMTRVTRRVFTRCTLYSTGPFTALLDSFFCDSETLDYSLVNLTTGWQSQGSDRDLNRVDHRVPLLTQFSHALRAYQKPHSTI